MTDAAPYPVPAGDARREDVIERSRFLTSVARADSRADALQFIKRVSDEFADASHNCYAFLVGPPGSTACVGMSDAGEPHGTAGKPMLNALLYGGVGDVSVVVTRYFGGRKLGRGGLVRAYGGCVKEALLGLATTTKVSFVALRMTIPYPLLEALKRMYEGFGVELIRESFGDQVEHHVRLPAEHCEGFQRAVCDATRGQVAPEPADDR